ncbi:ABC transporter ATP-binding protein [Streptococcus suis]|uniref:ABC transporter ATP-binding protein n=1 Tax=Streptococcus suis TaxID=1307 RepID=UPI0038BA7A38
MLKVVDVCKRYGAHQVLSYVSFELQAGDLVALVGPNGVGKSTLLNIISNTETADRGSVTINGRSNSDRAIFQDMSVMLDAQALYPQLTGYDHLTYVAATHKLGKKEVDGLVEELGMGYYVKKRVAGYSMGMKQKLLFAMAVLPKPKLLLLDEPHIGLDPTNIIQQREFLLTLQAEGVAILLSSHHLSEIEKLTNQVYFLKASKLIATEVELTADYDYHLAVENSKQVQEFLRDYPQLLWKKAEQGLVEIFLPERDLLDCLDRIPIQQVAGLTKASDYMESLYRDLYVEEGGEGT